MWGFKIQKPYLGLNNPSENFKIHWPRRLWRLAKIVERAAPDLTRDLRSKWRLCPDGPWLWSVLESSPSSGGLWHRTNLWITCRLINDLTKSVKWFTAQNILQVALMVSDDVERPVGQHPLTNGCWFSHDYLRVGITAHVHVHLKFKKNYFKFYSRGNWLSFDTKYTEEMVRRRCPRSKIRKTKLNYFVILKFLP